MVRPAVVFILASALAVPTSTFAGQRRSAPEPAPAATAAPGGEQGVPTQGARETRSDLERLLEQYPPSLGRVLRLDPTLLTNQDYLTPYPALATFLAQHGEVAHNPSYFLARYDQTFGSPGDPKDRAYATWNKVLEGFTALLVFGTIFSGVVWLIRTAVDHRRWTKQTKIQTDVHTKLLDRFTSNEDLLAYIQTPAGRRFLESTPIVVDGPRSLSAPLGRILWSMQLAAILAIGGIGIEIVAARAIDEVAQPLSAIGIVVIAIGIGFGVSAALAYLMSRRLGLLGPEPAAAEPRG
jgi:hypothetical protein